MTVIATLIPKTTKAASLPRLGVDEGPLGSDARWIFLELTLRPLRSEGGRMYVDAKAAIGKLGKPWKRGGRSLRAVNPFGG